MSDHLVRATDAELAEVLRLDGEARAPWGMTLAAAGEYADLLRRIGPRVCRELATLREERIRLDSALTGCGFPARGASDTLTERVARLVEAAMTGGGEP